MSRRIKEFAAIVATGDGVIGILAPRKHMLLWSSGPEGYRRLVEGLAERPALVRALAAVELGAGLWLALRQYEGVGE